MINIRKPVKFKFDGVIFRVSGTHDNNSKYEVYVSKGEYRVAYEGQTSDDDHTAPYSYKDLEKNLVTEKTWIPDRIIKEQDD